MLLSGLCVAIKAHNALFSFTVLIDRILWGRFMQNRKIQNTLMSFCHKKRKTKQKTLKSN